MGNLRSMGEVAERYRRTGVEKGHGRMRGLAEVDGYRDVQHGIGW